MSHNQEIRRELQAEAARMASAEAIDRLQVKIGNPMHRPCFSRQAKIEEIEAAGFFPEGFQARSPNTGVWYPISAFRITPSATINGRQEIGYFINLDDGLPGCERFILDLDAE
jgi:hypothetical protein